MQYKVLRLSLSMLFSLACAANGGRIASQGVLGPEAAAAGGVAADAASASAQHDAHGAQWASQESVDALTAKLEATHEAVEDLHVQLEGWTREMYKTIERSNADMLDEISRMQQETAAATAAVTLMPQVAAGSRAAAEALGRLGEAARDQVLALVKLVQSGDKEVAGGLASFAIASTVPALAEKAVISLAEAPKGQGIEELRKLAAPQIAVNLRDKAVEGLALVLEDDDERVREAAAEALCGLGAAAEGLALQQAVAALTKVVWEDRFSPSVRAAAAAALGSLGPAAEEPARRQAARALAKALDDRVRADVSEAAARALGELGPAAEAAVPALVSAVSRSTRRFFTAQDGLFFRNDDLNRYARESLEKIRGK